jgi:hypothetical protein
VAESLGTEHGGNHFDFFNSVRNKYISNVFYCTFCYPADRLAKQLVRVGYAWLCYVDGKAPSRRDMWPTRSKYTHNSMHLMQSSHTVQCAWGKRHNTALCLALHLNVCFKTDRPTSERNRILHCKMISTKITMGSAYRLLHAGFLLDLLFDSEGEATCFSETSVDVQWTIRRQIPADRTLNSNELKLVLTLTTYNISSIHCILRKFSKLSF